MEKKKVIFFLQGLLCWLLLFPYRCFNLKLGEIVFMYKNYLSNQMMLGWHLLASRSWAEFWSVLPCAGAGAEPPKLSVPGTGTAQAVQEELGLVCRARQGRDCCLQGTTWETLAPWGNKECPASACSSALSTRPSLSLSVYVNRCNKVLKARDSPPKTLCFG